MDDFYNDVGRFREQYDRVRAEVAELIGLSSYLDYEQVVGLCIALRLILEEVDTMLKEVEGLR